MHLNLNSSTIYKSQVLEATQVPTSKWMDQETMAHLKDGILHSTKKEEVPTFHNSIDGMGEHYGKWKKPGGERQTPYDLIYKWNLINKTHKQAKYSQRHWNKKQTDSNQRGEDRGIRGENGGRVIKKHVQRTHGQSPRG